MRLSHSFSFLETAQRPSAETPRMTQMKANLVKRKQTRNNSNKWGPLEDTTSQEATTKWKCLLVFRWHQDTCASSTKRKCGLAFGARETGARENGSGETILTRRWTTHRGTMHAPRWIRHGRRDAKWSTARPTWFVVDAPAEPLTSCQSIAQGDNHK